MAKGPSQTATTTQSGSSTTALPDWLSNAAREATDRAVALSNQTPAAYTGQLVADQSPDTSAAYQNVRNLQNAANPAYSTAANAWNGVIGQLAPQTAAGVNDLSSQLYGNFQGNVLNPATGLLGGYMSGGPATAQQVGANAQTLMTPYQQQVIDPTIAAGQRQLALAKQGIAAQANNVGAFGGSRMGVQEGVADAQAALGTQQTIGNLLNAGWGQALTPAYGTAMQAGQQGYGAATGLANLSSAGYGQALTAGTGIANQNLQTGLLAGQQLPTQAANQASLGLTLAQALSGVGTAEQGQQQQGLNAAYGQFQQQQNQPYMNLDVLLSALSGVPYGTTTTSSGTDTTRQTTDPGLLNTIGAYVGFGSKIGSTAAKVAGAV
jgi:hypothetical protein